MKLTTKQIAMTGLLLAVCIASQFFKNLSVFITGPVVNACLILTLFAAGLIPAVILSTITPITAFFITGNPVMAAIPLMMPMIMLGNVILVLGIFLAGFKTKPRMAIGMVIGSVLKAVFMGLTISLWLLPSFLPEQLFPKLSVLQMNFSVIQLATALIGCVIAFIVWIPVKKIVNDPLAEAANSVNV